MFEELTATLSEEQAKYTIANPVPFYQSVQEKMGAFGLKPRLHRTLRLNHEQSVKKIWLTWS